MHLDPLLGWIPFLPLLGFLLNGLLGARMPTWAVGLLAVAGPAAAFVLSVLALLAVQEGHGHALHHIYWTWMSAGDFAVNVGFQVDSLTAVMLMNVAGIGTAIHVYSYGYMREDPGFARFMAYLNLFLCAMLVLVMADNLLVLFVGWEGVGLCSYLLIGFWYDKFENVDAGRKAFIVNRIGDLLFLIGVFTLFAMTGTVSFEGMEHAFAGLMVGDEVLAGPFAGFTVGAVLAFAALCLFGGATGKSAQIPLYVWLPDAMAGPTPVSALIHAATMVTAGIYLVARMDFLFVLLPEVGQVVALVAAVTAMVAALIALGQNDIKKIIAYSTVSQLGYMFCGVATTVWVSGLFHVVTHASFKALLFLGAGAVIVAMHHEQDIRKMGGLWRDLKFVTFLFLIGSLAGAGFPGTSGFFSKDEILASVHLAMTAQGGLWPVVFGLLGATAVLTALYTTRLFMIAFMGSPADPHRHLHPVHWTMTLVLVLLTTIAATGGLLGLGEWMHEFTHPAWSEAAWMHELPHDAAHHSHLVATWLSVIAVAIGIGGGVTLYGPFRPQLAAFVEGNGRAAHQVLANKFYVDEVYDRVVVQPIGSLARGLWALVDRAFIDGFLVEGTGRLVVQLAGAMRVAQNGAVSVATTTTLVGALVILVVLWVSHG